MVDFCRKVSPGLAEWKIWVLHRTGKIFKDRTFDRGTLESKGDWKRPADLPSSKSAAVLKSRLTVISPGLSSFSKPIALDCKKLRYFGFQIL